MIRDMNTMPTSLAPIQPANSVPLLPSQDAALQSAIAEAQQAIGCGRAHAAISKLSAAIGSDHRTFHDIFLNLLDSSPAPLRSELIQEALAQRPDFNLHAFNKDGKTLLDLAVRHDDRELARYLLGKGAKPEQLSLGAASQDMQALLISWRRKNLLYAHFNEGNKRCSQTPLDRLLLEGRHEEVRERVAGIIEENGVRWVWEEAMNDGLHDILRALLVVGTPDELSELTEGKYSVGQSIEALRADPGLSAVLKEFPYQSAKRGQPKNFNGGAKFPDTNVDILCLHLATHLQMQQAKNPRVKFDYHEFSSTKTIANKVKPDIDKTYEALKAQASESHLIDNRRFGQFLAKQFEAMEKDGKQSKLMLVLSTNHVMNIGLRIKEKNGKKSYVAKFFDPNETTTVTRSKADRAQTFETQTLSSYITNENRLNAYYPEPVGMSMIYVHPKEGEQASTAIDSRVGRTLTSMDIEEIDAFVIWILMRESFPGNLRQLHDYFSSLPEDKQIELLPGRDADGRPALFMSMQEGYADAIAAYGELLKQCGSISQDQLIELLAAKSKGTPALFMSMQEGHVGAITAYGELLKKFESILQDKRIDLLAAKYHGTPALFVSMQNGHAEAITVYSELLKQCGSIPQDQLIELLTAKYKDIPALYQCMQQGHAKAITAYGELLKQFESILQEQLINLLAANTKGWPALFIGMQKGHMEAVKAYGNLVKLAPPDKQADLLLAKISADQLQDKSSLQIALENGYFEAANVLIQLLMQLAPDLSPEKRATLLKEVKPQEKFLERSMSIHSSHLRDWGKLKNSFSALKTELSK